MTKSWFSHIARLAVTSLLIGSVALGSSSAPAASTEVVDVTGQTKISPTTGGFGTGIDPVDLWGHSIAPLLGTAQVGVLFEQLGDDIDGEAAEDRSGISVAMSADGDTVIIGALGNDGAGNAAGHARIFDWDGSSWVQRGSDIDGETAVDGSGTSVAISADGDTVITGAPFNDDAGNAAGHARIFDWDGSSWVQRGSDIDGEAADDFSGGSVAMSADGDTVIIGADGNDGAGDLAGHARIFDWDGSSWVQRGSDIDGETELDRSEAVAMSADGDTVIIGAYGNVGAGDLAGHARIFDWDGGSWVQRGRDIDGESARDLSGWTVAMNADGDTVIIGAWGNDGAGDQAGHARIFDWEGSSWLQRGSDIDGETELDHSGSSVAMSADGDTVIIGAGSNDGAGYAAGHARIFNWDGSSWVQQGGDIDGEAARDSSGGAVAMSADGDTVIIGATGNDGAGLEAGHARVYRAGYTCAGLPATIVGSDGPDSLTGTPGDDVIVSLGGNDLVRGGGGNDTICTGDGNDQAFGGSGNDTIDGGEGRDNLRGNAGNDTILGGPGNDLIRGDNGHDIVDGGDGNDNIETGDGVDIIDGGDGNDVVRAGKGNDVVSGGNGDDRLMGQVGDDTLDGGDGFDRLRGGAGTDSCTAGEIVQTCETV